MPAQRPNAAFDPIPPDLDLAALVEKTPNFQYAVRIPCNMIEHQGIEAFEKLVLLHVIIGGKPLVIDGYHQRLDPWIFTPQWLRDNVGKQFEQARNLTKKENITLSMKHYLDNLPMLTNQWDPFNYREKHRQRVYLKDIDCPDIWHNKLKEHIPPGVFYLNDSTGDIGGPGCIQEINCHGLMKRMGRGTARAGDLMSCLPSSMRAENMMCYIGHEGTYTPCHREMCASLGQNIMVEASGTTGEDGKPAKPGSSIWFMTETKDRHLVSEYWLSALGHDIEVEAHYAQTNAWKNAPFTTYIVDQRVGDFILIPPLAPHQVWNRGTRTMKVAWNRTTVETLEMAMNEALPRARMVCRDEQYKNKSIVLFTLQKYSSLLSHVEDELHTSPDPQQIMDLTYSPRIRQLRKDLKRLFALYTRILLSEAFSPDLPPEKKVQFLPYDSNVTCSYCRCNIFNRFLTCSSCIISLDGEEDTYDICMECYSMGRSCYCLSRLTWVEQFPWQDLIQKHDVWRNQIIHFEGGLSIGSPQEFNIERSHQTTRSLAEICQRQLKLRPWRDPKIEHVEEVNDTDDEIEREEGIKARNARKRRKIRRSIKALKETLACHICKDRAPLWKLAVCDCGHSYCYGSLWRAFDIMPQTVMENPQWKCPKCLKICSCKDCRKDPDSKPFEPAGTTLGHDTKKVADPRSVEALVDFSRSNMHWIKKAGDDQLHETRRIQRKQNEAAREKSQLLSLGEYYVDEDGPDVTPSTPKSVDMEVEIPIDPLLISDLPVLSNNRGYAEADEDYVDERYAADPSAYQKRVELEESFSAQPMRKAAADALKALNAYNLRNEPLAGLRNLNSQIDPCLTVAPRSTVHDQTRLGGTEDFQHDDGSSQAVNFQVPCNHKPSEDQTSSQTDYTPVKRKRTSNRARDLVKSHAKPSAKKPVGQNLRSRTKGKARGPNSSGIVDQAASGKQLTISFPIDCSKVGTAESQQRTQITSNSAPSERDVDPKDEFAQLNNFQGTQNNSLSPTRLERSISVDPLRALADGHAGKETPKTRISQPDIIDQNSSRQDAQLAVLSNDITKSTIDQGPQSAGLGFSVKAKGKPKRDGHVSTAKSDATEGAQSAVLANDITKNTIHEGPQSAGLGSSVKAKGKPKRDGHVSTAKSDATEGANDESASRREKNLIAKLNAWAEVTAKGYESESDSGDSLINFTSPKKQQDIFNSPRAKRLSSKGIITTPRLSPSPVKAARTSIFSRPRKGKIRIIAA